METILPEQVPYLCSIGNWGWKLNPVEPGCQNPDHDPPLCMLLNQGFYLHICSGCGDRTVFSVSH